MTSDIWSVVAPVLVLVLVAVLIWCWIDPGIIGPVVEHIPVDLDR